MKQKMLGRFPIYYKNYGWKLDVDKTVWKNINKSLIEYYKENDNNFDNLCQSLNGFNYEIKDCGEDHFDFAVDDMVFTIFRDRETDKVWLSTGIFIDVEDDCEDVDVNLVD